MRTFVGIATICLGGAVGFPADPGAADEPAAVSSRAGLPGCWSVEIKLPWPMPNKRGELCFARGEAGLEGRLRLEEAWKDVTDLSTNGTTFRFRCETSRGPARFSGTVTGHTMTGEVELTRGTRPFEGARK